MIKEKERNYSDVFLSKNHYLVDSSSNFIDQIPAIIELINKYSGINFDWSSQEKTNRLKDKDLVQIENVVSQEAQREIVEIFSPYVKPHINKIYGTRMNYSIRVSAQVKGCWSKDNEMVRNTGFWEKGIFHEDKVRKNFSFPTRAHQDLDNNGFRGSHTIIFFFQMTKPVKNSSLLEHAEFDKKVGIVEYSDKYGYPNEILKEEQKKLHWKSKGLNLGEISIFDPFTIHRSTSISVVPRIALNIKIQPTNLDYLENIYGCDLEYCKSAKGQRKQLSRLFGLLDQLSKKNRILLFEKAVVAFLLKEFNYAEKAIEELCLFRVSKIQIKKILLGSVLRKISIMINSNDMTLYNNPNNNIRQFSCGESIFNTINN